MLLEEKVESVMTETADLLTLLSAGGSAKRVAWGFGTVGAAVQQEAIARIKPFDRTKDEKKKRINT